MCTLLLFLGALGPTETPSALQAMQSASSQVRKSRITFVVTTRAHGAWAEPYYYEYRSAGEQEILKDRGPLSQYGRKDEDGEPLPSPEKWWFYDGKALWSYWGESTGASCSEEEWDVSGRGHLFIPLLQAGSYPYPST